MKEQNDKDTRMFIWLAVFVIIVLIYLLAVGIEGKPREYKSDILKLTGVLSWLIWRIIERAKYKRLSEPV